MFCEATCVKATQCTRLFLNNFAFLVRHHVDEAVLLELLDESA